MKNQTVSAASLGAALLLAGGAARAQNVHVLRPAHNAVVRETVQVRVAPGDLPPAGYASISIDGKFRTARALTGSRTAPVYSWDTKTAGGASGDGAHTLQVNIFRDNGVFIGSDTIPVHVANAITNIPPGGVRLAYKWPVQPHAVYHRETSMTIAAADATPPVPGAADQVLQESQLVFTRSALEPTARAGLIRDLVVSGTVTSPGQSLAILRAYNVQPERRTVNVRGIVLSRESADDYMDHIGFPLPELPNKARVDKGDSWQSPVTVGLNWDATSAAHVTAECRVEGFEWQDNYPTAKIRETYTGPARFTSQPPTASGHAAPPLLSASSITFDRVLYFAYGSGRLVKSVTNTKVTLTAEQMSSLGASAQGAAPGFAGPPPGYGGPGGPGGFGPGVPGVPYPGFPGPPPGYGGPGGPGGGYPGPGRPVGASNAQQSGPPPGFQGGVYGPGTPSVPYPGFPGPPPGYGGPGGPGGFGPGVPGVPYPGFPGPPPGYGGPGGPGGFQSVPTPGEDQGQPYNGGQAAPQSVNTTLTVTETTTLQTP